MKIKNLLLTILAICLLTFTFGVANNSAHAMSASDANANNTVYDVSEHQGVFTDQQVQQLKSEVPFMILRVQQGSAYSDHTFQQNRDLMNKYNIPYGVYSYSQYENPSDAADEARTLYNRAPNARFYVNDYEDQTVTSGGTNESTEAWINALRPLVGQRKILFYSYAYFMEAHAAEAISSYDGYWLPNYNDTEPAREHVLWQFTSSFYSNALGQNIDASLLNSKDASWFVGNSASSNYVQPTNNTNTDQSSNNQSNNTNNNDQQNNNQSNNQQSNQQSNNQTTNSQNNNNQQNQQNSDQNNSSNNTDNNDNQPEQQPRNTSYVQQSKNMLIKAGYDYQIYNHVPGDNKFTDNTYAKASVSDYTRKSVYVNSIATVNGKTYYRLYYKGKSIGWVNTKALIPNVKYSTYYRTKTMKSNPKVNFNNHISNSGFSNVKVTANGHKYANKKLQVTRRAIKDGWNSYYYQAFYRGKLVGWIYQSAFK
ncbi:GW dipeptide domain-containing protein [Apilactobacillus apisilvae]|uniref:GW dipeptide domain-containing protein n=1 Tax=Apilactobacillus apisilvae TaxID=2923364 RepID=A0ABY4PGT7_9LACO|nr:GH25 family lysozyme [Apilactobacillus apisilvae]UQS84706.1 GW dipeptide domain-containing protein [Apilactobacillus apisilvae]